MTADRVTESEIPAILDWCSDQHIECLYFLANPSDREDVRRLQELGFRHVDTRVTLRRSSSISSAPPQLGGIVIRAFADADLEGLREIARTSHRNTRFSNDGHFPPHLCDALYVRWIEKSCHAPSDRVLVAEAAGRPVGYITCEREEGGGRIGLFAVGESVRGRGVGAALIRAAIEWFRSEGILDIVVTTQGNNEPAQRAYLKEGFSVDSVFLWLHYWPPPAPPASHP